METNGANGESQSAVNNLILDYYKKFGRKRDLEQFFSLSTAQSDLRDPSSSFWRKMKSQTDSDSAEKGSESSTELCRISIKCSIPEPTTSHEDYHKIKSDSESPPIISEEAPLPSRNSDNESIKSDDIQSHKSVDNTLDISANKPLSPTSSITSQRKLEWDSLADVGYANESDRKNSASSLSTLERLALHQQYSNNDTNKSDIGPPTAQSTPIDIDEIKTKNKKCFPKRTTKIYKKDIDLVELNVTNENMPQPINVNLTKHISFNVEKDGGITVENVTKNVSVSPEKVSVQTEVTPQVKLDKEIQTTLNKDKSSSSTDQKTTGKKQYPILISLNTLKKRTRKKKVKKILRRQPKKKIADKENVPLDKSGDQLSEAESFEYMPGHIYNLNQMKQTANEVKNVISNKSSLDSSEGLTTDSSKTAKYSFTKDLEKSIDVLKTALDNKCEDEKLKKKLVKEVVQRLIKSKYKDDESSSEFLSGLSFSSKKVDLFDSNQTASTSDTNATADETKQSKPKKSILRMDKFNSNVIASTSQSVPNLPIISKSENPISTYIKKPCGLSNTGSDVSTKSKNLSDNDIDKTSSEELYKKYLDALKREQAYKKHLKDKELFLKQKLASSDIAFNVARQADDKRQRIKDLMKDLIRNNYDDGSGDASKLEGSNSNMNSEHHNSLRKQRSHSVFTLSSGNSDHNKHKICSNKQNDKCSKACYKKPDEHYCCCPFHKSPPKIAVVDSSVQVNINAKNDICPDQVAQTSRENKKNEIFQQYCDRCQLRQNDMHIIPDKAMGEVKYVCVCADDVPEVPENFLIYKCSRLNKCSKVDEITSKASNSVSGQTSSEPTSLRRKTSFKSSDCERKCLTIKDNYNQISKSSQTNVNLPIKLQSKSSEQSISSSSDGIVSSSSRQRKLDTVADIGLPNKKAIYIHEATRWIQTEISINPKISDPSLTDINIVIDENCVKLVNEHYKEVPQAGSEKQRHEIYDHHLDLRSDVSSAGSKKTNDSKSMKCVFNNVKEKHTNIVDKLDKGIQLTPDDIISNIKSQENKSNPSNFIIPIEGTNMTLKVSLGSGPESQIPTKTIENELKDNVTLTSKETETEKNDVVENFTSLREECSKGVQSTNAEIFKAFYQQKTAPETNRKTYQDNFDADTYKENNNKASSCYIDNFISENCKYNTFPKNDANQIKKPLLRSNTDTGKIEDAYRITFNQNNAADIEAPIVKSNLQSKAASTNILQNKEETSSERSYVENNSKSKTSITDTDNQDNIKISNSEVDDKVKDPILDMIQDITRRYSKKDVERGKRKKCFKEIITVLNYLLDTEDSTDDQIKPSSSSACENVSVEKNLPVKENIRSVSSKTLVDKGVQLSIKKSKQKKFAESSDLPLSTDRPSTSTESGTCKVLNKIRRECDKYHQKRCKLHSSGKRCESSSSTSVNCDYCRYVHHCPGKGHKCRSHKKVTVEKGKKNCVAYNLIIQSSDSMVSEEVNYDNHRRQLKNIIVKVPSKKKVQNMPFKEVSAKIVNNMPHSPRKDNNYRSRSLPNENEVSSSDDLLKKAQEYTVREYLEKNRPDFVEKSSRRQNCLKIINESSPRDCDTPRLNMIVVHSPTIPNSCMDSCLCYQGVPLNNNCVCIDPYLHCVHNEVTRVANERAAKRQLLSVQLDRRQALSALSQTKLMEYAKQLGDELRRKKVAPKFISEKEMKKHSEKIYKSLPEVTRKKEEVKKENIKKTNLLMANIFKKNLQKKTLSGAVNLSNYSTVIKI